MSTFSLAGKGLKLDTAEDIKSHFQPLIDDDKVRHIDLSGNTLGDKACAEIANIIKNKTTLQSIDLHDIFTGRMVWEIPPAVDSLLSAVLDLPKIETIDLSDNAFGLKTKDPLVKFLAEHVPLRNLILNNNGMGPIAGESIAQALTTLAKKKEQAREGGKEVPYLETIVCGRNRLENGSMKAWAEAYNAHKSGIKSIRMTQNGIRPEGICALIDGGLSKCSKLEVFDLQDNTFTTPGATSLAKAITGWKDLKELGVGDAYLQSRGSIKVFEALSKGQNGSIEILKLDFNEITPAGLKVLYRAAKDGLPILRRIEINGNKFEEEDPMIEEISTLLSERKDKQGKEDDPENHWGIGDLDELEGEDSDEDDEEDIEEVEEKEVRESVIKDDDIAENSTVSQKGDKDVDELADVLAKTKV